MIYVNSDGGSRGNPGKGAIGIVIRERNKILEEYAEILTGKVTNNVAEYWALIKALKLVAQHTIGEITCILDSELVVNQLLGKYRVRNKKLLELFLKVQKLQEPFSKITYKHISREDKFQKHADYLLNKKLDEHLIKQ
jgi:ribonuclease HI